MNKSYELTNQNKVLVSDETGFKTERKHTENIDEILLAENDYEQLKVEQDYLHRMISRTKKNIKRLTKLTLKSGAVIVVGTAAIGALTAFGPAIIIGGCTLGGAEWFLHACKKDDQKRLAGYEMQKASIDNRKYDLGKEIAKKKEEAKIAEFDAAKASRIQEVAQMSKELEDYLDNEVTPLYITGYSKEPEKYRPKHLSLHN